MDLIRIITDATKEIATNTFSILLTLVALPVYLFIIILVFIPAYLIASIENEIKSNNHGNDNSQGH